NLSRIADPQLQLQLLQQSFKPARMPTGFHAHTYFLTRSRESTIELLCLLWMGKPFLLELSSVLVQQCDLLKLGVVIDSYNDHCSAPFSRACWLALHHQLYSGLGADIVMESISPTTGRDRRFDTGLLSTILASGTIPGPKVSISACGN